jgi:spermidine synthase
MQRSLTRRDKEARRRLLFGLFFVSGFCGLVYQVVWTRLAFAAFGIITPVLSVVISVFMLGLAIGSWGGGRWISRWVERTRRSAIIYYGSAELVIGLGAFVVPALFTGGGHLLLSAGQADSSRYLVLSALVLAISVLPWCLCMGATFPLMMAYIREWETTDTKTFSSLYLPNVLGAVSGTLLSALVLIELLGFQRTLWVAAAGNFVIAAISFKLGGAGRQQTVGTGPAAEAAAHAAAIRAGNNQSNRSFQWILFSTGFISMALGVVWVRSFAPVLKTQVYSFALVLASYLSATFLGSWYYRYQCHTKSQFTIPTLVACLALAAFFPVMLNDARLVRAHWGAELDPLSMIALLASIGPLCAVLGYLTPCLVDQCALGSPAAAGRAYALNVLGCILGPLAASYLLLPWVNERFVQILVAMPLVGFFVLFAGKLRKEARLAFGGVLVIVVSWAALLSQNYEDYLAAANKRTEIHRDYAASVIAFEDNSRKHLLVNGIGMTALTPVTKFMTHLPLAFHKEPPQSALVICFGMGTSYRSALSWGIDTTAVELVPSVPETFGFYYADARQVLANPKGRIVIDDGRRFLCRTREKFDLIIIDPPPPVEAAGSSLLYSRDFYEVAKQRLRPGGILQAWYPEARDRTFQAVLRSVCESFSYVRSFESIGKWGTHILASMQPIETCTAEELAARMPESAKEDLLEWGGWPSIPRCLQDVLSTEVPVADLLNPKPQIRVTDDRPFNEYFLLRRANLVR